MINTRKLIKQAIIIALSTYLHTYTTPTTTTLELPVPQSLESKKYKTRMRKAKTEKKKKIYTYRDMDYDELILAKNKQVESRNYTSAIKYLEQLIKLCTDINKASDHVLEVADILFTDGQYQRAARMYTDFATLYPGKEKVEYALYRAIVSSFVCILPCDRDQSKTEETLSLAAAFLKQDHFTQYKDEVSALFAQCQQRLIESELSICQFYIKRGRLKPAQRRLDTLKSTWLPLVPSMEQTLNTCQEELNMQDMLQKERTEKMIIAHNNTRKKAAERF